MSTSSAPYPQHIYDQRRIQIAQGILQKEFRKLFPDLPDSSWPIIDNSVEDWPLNPEKYHLENDNVRDFWDSFAAVIEGIKLKPNFTAWITAQNVSWTRTEISLDKLQMSSLLDQLNSIPTLQLHSDLSLAEITIALQDQPDVRAQQQRIINQHDTAPSQNNCPIIVALTDNSTYKILDGNRRALRALLYESDTIDAWIGELEGSSPNNFWVPVNDLFQIVKVYKKATDENNKTLQESTVQVLQSILQDNFVAQKAYENRVSNASPLAKELFELASK